MFNKTLLVYAEKLSEKHLEVVRKMREIIETEGRKCTVIKASELKEEFFQDLDLVITAGGDGTFIRASHFLKNTPILGINSEPEFSEGALTSITDSELDKFEEILSGNYIKKETSRAEIKLNGKILEKLALNEVYIGSTTQFHTSRYIIKFKDKEEDHRSSGVLVVSASGSTAWYKSAGGKPFTEQEKMKFLVREPFLGRLFKPELLEGEITKGEKIEFEAGRYKGGLLAIDSNITYNFNIPDKVEISLSDQPLSILEAKEKWKLDYLEEALTPYIKII